MQLDDEDMDLITRAMIAEARTQGPIGMAAVANVIKNRSVKRKLKPADVVLETNQFEPFNTSHIGGPNDPAKIDMGSEQYARARRIAESIFAGQSPDYTNGATHFANVATVRARNGGTVGNHGWINDRNKTTRIGAHDFFAPEGRVNSFNNEMTLPTYQGANPIKPIEPIAGFQGAQGATGGQSMPDMADPSASPAGPMKPQGQGPDQGGMFSGMFKPQGGAPGGQGSPPMLGRILFGDGGLQGFMKSAIPTPFGGKGIIGGGFDGLKGMMSGAGSIPGMAGAGATGAPMMLPGAAGLSAAPAAAAALPAAAPAAAAAAPAAASAIPGFLSSLFALL